MRHLDLPVHPTLRHPLTGEPLRAVYVTKTGVTRWPVLGAAPDGSDAQSGSGSGSDTDSGGDGRGNGSGAGSGSGTGSGGGSGTGSGTGGGRGDSGNATDGSGNDLGYPRDTPIAEMNDKQQTAYWRHQARRHEGRVKDLVGDRRPEEVKGDLDAYAKIQRDQQTPSEQAVNDAVERGRTEGRTAERRNTAATLFRGALEANGVAGDDLDEITRNFSVDAYITDQGVDTSKITSFAKRFTTSARDNQQHERRRDFGGGQRREGTPERGAAGKAMAERRFGKQK